MADQLTRLYRSLTGQERLSAALAAVTRHDELDVERLCAAGEPKLYWISDLLPAWLAMSEVGKGNRQERLELAALMYRAMWAGESHEPDADSGKRLTSAGRAYAALLLACRDGWAIFCHDRGIDPSAPVGGTEPDVLASAESDAAGLAFSSTELLSYVRERDSSASAVLNPETVAAQLQARYDGWLKRLSSA